MSLQKKIRLRFFSVVLLFIITGVIAYPPVIKFAPTLYNKINQWKINLGLDLQGGIHLEYKADLSQTPKDKQAEAMQAAQAVIERRVNAFGVGEAMVQTAFSGGEHRIIVELPGVKDIDGAKKMLKETPFLEFKEERSPDDPVFKVLEDSNKKAKEEAQKVLQEAKEGKDFAELAKKYSQDPGSRAEGGDLGWVKKGQLVPEFEKVAFSPDLKNGEIYPDLVETQFGWHIIKKIEERGKDDQKEVHVAHILLAKKTLEMYPDLKYKSTGLTGKDLESAAVTYPNQGVGEPQVALKFNKEGAKLFAEITKRNLHKTVAIYLDGKIISAPVVQAEITNGEAVITGNFTTEEAKKLKQRLNEGALPVPIELISQQSVEASLGMRSLQKSLKAGLWGLLAVMIFMIVYYRFLGLVASIALIIYTTMMITIFKLSGILSPWPITLTLSGIAGFILSVGMAVDANILIFERTKEELKLGRNLQGAIKEGFKRAWPSIRDGNLSTLITSFILISIGTGFVKGFAIILVIGVLLSMFTAIVIVKYILQFIIGDWAEKYKKFIV